MTVIYGQHFIDGIVMIADSRASKINADNTYDPWRDNTQKIFHLGEHLFISFCGDIGVAGSIIAFLLEQINLKPNLGNPFVFFDKGPKLIKYAHKCLSAQANRKIDVGFIIGGIDFNRPQPIKDKDGKITGHMPFFDKKLFKISSPDFQPVESDVIKHPILILGSGASVIDKLEEDLKSLYKFGGINDLNGLWGRASVASGSLKEGIEKLGIDSVGGLFQIVMIGPNGSGFLPYKSRSPQNKDPIKLDLEMTIKNGRWVQIDLNTGKEIEILHPLEVVKIEDNSPELFAILEE